MELKLPSRGEVIKRQDEYVRTLINYNVRNVVDAMNKGMLNSLKGEVILRSLESSIRCPQNIADCVLLELRALYPKDWYFRQYRDHWGLINIQWQDHPFPEPPKTLRERIKAWLTS